MKSLCQDESNVNVHLFRCLFKLDTAVFMQVHCGAPFLLILVTLYVKSHHQCKKSQRLLKTIFSHIRDLDKEIYCAAI